MNILHKFIVKKLTIYFIMGELSETSWYFPTCNIFPVHGQKQPGTKTPPLKIKMDYCNTFIFRWFCPRGYCVSTMCLRFVYCVSTVCLLCVFSVHIGLAGGHWPFLESFKFFSYILKVYLYVFIMNWQVLVWYQFILCVQQL